MSNQFSAELLISTTKANKDLQAMNQQVRNLDKSLAGLGKTLQANQKDLDAAVKGISAIVTASREASKASEESARAKLAEAKAQAELSKAENASNIANSRVERERSAAAVNQSTVAYRNARTEAIQFAAAQRAAKASTDDFGNSLSNQRYLLYDVGATYRTLGLAASALPAAAVAAAASYEKSFAQVIRVSGVTGVAAGELRDQLKGLATEIPLTFAELANIAQIGGQMDIDASQLAAFTETVAKFVATADGATIDSTTQAFGRLSNLFASDLSDPEQAKFFERIGSAISYTADNAVTSEAKIISLLEKIAPIAAQAGFAAEEVVGLGSALSSVGLAPEISSGFLTRFFGQLNKDVAAGGDAISAYNKVLGTTSDEFYQLYQNDPSELLRRLIESLSELDKVGQTQALNDLGIKATRDQRVVQALAGSYEVLEQALTDSSQAYAESSYLDQSSQGIFNTLIANLTKLGNSLANLGDTVGSGLIPTLSSFVNILQFAVDGVNDLANTSPAVKTFLATLTTIGSVVGIFFALKSASAFFTAGLVTLTHVTRQASGSSLTFTGQLRNLAAAQLQAKGFTEQASAAYIKQVGAVRALGAASTLSTVQVRALNVAMASGGTVATSFGATVKGAGSVLLSAVGGPVGIAVGALALLGSSWLTASAEAKQASEEIVNAFDASGEAGAKALADSFATDTVSFFDRDGISTLNLWGNTWGEVASQAGVAIEDIAAALSGGKSAYDEFIKNQRAIAVEGIRSGEWSRGQIDAFNTLLPKLESYGEGLSDAETAADNYNKIAGELNLNVDESGESFDGATDEVEDYAKALNDAIEAVFGLTNAQAGVNAALESLGAGVQKSGSIGTGSADARSNLADFQKALSLQATYLQQQIEAGKISAQQGAVQFQQFAQGLLGELSNLGVDTSQIVGDVSNAISAVQAKFAEQGGDIAPVEIPISANGTQAIMETDAILAWMSDFLQSNPQLAEIGLTGEDQTADKVYNLISYISEATGMPFEAVVDAITNPAGKETENVTKFMLQAVNQDFTAYINADTSTAARNVQDFAAYVQQQLAELTASLASNNTGFFGDAASFFGGVGNILGSIPKVLATPAQTIAKANTAAAPTFKPLNQGYDDAAKKAQEAGNKAAGAGKKAKKAGDDAAKGSKKASDSLKDQAKDWDELEKQISGYASRVGSAFSNVTARQTGVDQAIDDYYTVLNGINERLAQQKQAVKDLRAENKALASERQVEINDAEKLEKMARYADQVGNSERAKVYRDEAKALRASADETKAKISQNEKEAKTIETGIGNLKGYSKEAITNRNELRTLRDASLKVSEAYAASGASAKTVASETAKWTGKAKDHSKQLGYNKTDVDKVVGSTKTYVTELKKVPKTISTSVTAKNNTKSGVDAAKKSIGSVPSSKTSTITAKGSGISGVNKDLNNASKSRTSTISAKFDANTKKRFRELSALYSVMPGAGITLSGIFRNLSFLNQGGKVGRDGIRKFNNGGLVPGTPPVNPRQDNIMATLDGKGIAAIRSGEYVQSQPAVDYYGSDFMDKLNRMEIPKYAMGGVVGNARSNSQTGPSVIDLSAETIQSIARLVQKDIYLYADNQMLAQSVHKGNVAIAQQGGVL